jgi:hypothetical protein
LSKTHAAQQMERGTNQLVTIDQSSSRAYDLMVYK